ncbi:MAG: mannose-6-phosphate isomerase, class I [Treponema sp.]|jgi:mannose-6-phosphate isomerase|nr:mannose-6-phosphate isomerase, class I [Treponema sp.]
MTELNRRVSEEGGSPPALYKLCNQVKHYDWGSPDWIPRLLGAENPEALPWAELWMGSHPGSPSRVSVPTEKGAGQGAASEGSLSLGELIAENPARFLGVEGARRFTGLPFLLKLLAAAKPLSIQAHPNLEQAKAGFERENCAGLPPDAPERNYKDPNHKPEIICALSPFTGMCGFRGAAEIREGLERFLSPAPRSLKRGFPPLFKALENRDEPAALGEFLAAVFGLSAGLREELTAYILGAGSPPGAEGPGLARGEIIRRLAELYPGDPAVLAPLYLNLFRLEPGEAVFLHAGVLHAYLQGLGVELMANSDNVLRGGLSSKHVDLPELMRILDFKPMKPAIIRPPEKTDPGETAASSFVYPSPCDEFSLAVHRSGGGEMLFSGGGLAVCVVTRGRLEIAAAQAGAAPPAVILKQGESVFIPAAENGKLLFRGDYTAYSASIPGGAGGGRPAKPAAP